MEDITDQVIVQAPLGRVWAAIQGPAEHVKWHPFATHIDGEHALGVTRTCSVLIGGKPGSSRERCSDLRRGPDDHVDRRAGQQAGSPAWCRTGAPASSLEPQGSAATRVTAQSLFTPKRYARAPDDARDPAQVPPDSARDPRRASAARGALSDMSAANPDSHAFPLLPVSAATRCSAARRSREEDVRRDGSARRRQGPHVVVEGHARRQDPGVAGRQFHRRRAGQAIRPRPWTHEPDPRAAVFASASDQWPDQARVVPLLGMKQA